MKNTIEDITTRIDEAEKLNTNKADAVRLQLEELKAKAARREVAGHNYREDRRKRQKNI